MKNTSRNVNLHGGIDKMDPNISIPETWAENSNRNIQESQSSITFIYYPNIFPPFFLFVWRTKSGIGGSG
jgi:hypothetical protein